MQRPFSGELNQLRIDSGKLTVESDCHVNSQLNNHSQLKDAPAFTF
jgi:hypothetical protein